MQFNIRMGIPEMEALWEDLKGRSQNGQLGGDEQKDYRGWAKPSCFCN
jgi:hypothetical protein